MKRLILISLLSSSSAFAIDDQCTSNVDAVVVAVNSILPQGELVGMTTEQVDNARKSIDELSKKRMNTADCDLFPFAKQILQDAKVKL